VFRKNADSSRHFETSLRLLLYFAVLYMDMEILNFLFLFRSNDIVLCGGLMK